MEYSGSRMLEETVLGWLRESLLTEEALQKLLRQANAYLEQLARAPRPNVVPLEKKLRQLCRRIDKLVTLVEAEEDPQQCQGYQRRIRQLERERMELEEELAQLRRAGLSWTRIQEEMQRLHNHRFSEATLRRAWKWATRDGLQRAIAARGKVPRHPLARGTQAPAGSNPGRQASR